MLYKHTILEHPGEENNLFKIKFETFRNECQDQYCKINLKFLTARAYEAQQKATIKVNVFKYLGANVNEIIDHNFTASFQLNPLAEP